MKKIKFILLYLMVCFAKLEAQTITGVVVDEANQPIAFANVVLKMLPDSVFLQGTITDEQGKFVLDKVNQNEKLLQISCLGYESLNQPVMTGDMGILSLRSSTIMLGETVITGRRPTYSLKGSSLTTNVENTLLSSLGTANDVLKRIPGIKTDDGAIEVFGKGTPLIYINGRKVRDLSELEELNSRDIAKVELITNPGAEYDAEVKSVLKIKTVRRTGEGWGSNVRSMFQKGRLWSNNQQLALNYRKNSLDIFGSFYYYKQKRRTKQEDLQTVYVDKQLEIEGDSEGPYSTENIQGEGGANYQLNENNFLGIRYTYNHYSSDSHVYSLFYVRENHLDFDQFDFSNAIDGSGKTHKVNAYYTGLWGKKLNVDFNVDWLYSDNHTRQNITEDSMNEDDRTVHSTSGARNNLYAGKLVFSYPLPVGTLQFGTEISWTNRHSHYVNEEHFMDDAFDKITSSNQAGFISYDLPVGKTSLNAGLRYEHVSFNYYEDEVKKEEQCKNYNNLFPSLSFSFPIKKAQFTLGYSTRIQRPSYFMLRSDVQYANRYTYERGNPLLQPEISHELSFQAGYKFIQLSAYYSYTKDAVLSVARPNESDNRITVFRVENVYSWQNFGTVVSLSPKIGIWEPIWNLQFMRQILMGEYRGELKHFNRPALAADWNNQFNLPGQFILSIDASCNNSYHSGYNRMKAVAWMDCGIRKSFFKNTLDVSIQVNDVFASKKEKYLIYGQRVIFNKWADNDSRQVRFRLAYRFNSSPSKYKGTGAANDELRRL